MSHSIENEGVIKNKQRHKFAFKRCNFEHPSVDGNLCKISYEVKVIIVKRVFGIKNIYTRTIFFNKKPEKRLINPSLEICFGTKHFSAILSLNKTRFCLDDFFEGQIRISSEINLFSVKLLVLQEEEMGKGDKSEKKVFKLANFEVVDGHPFEDEVIPFRCKVDQYINTRSLSLEKIYVVRHFLTIELTGEDMQYAKSQEIEILG